MCLIDEKPDVIFLDLVMPQINGFEVLKKLKENPETEHIPVIILSSKILSYQEKADLEQHIVAILTKEAPSREAAVMKIKNTVLKVLNLQSQGGDV
ncbi:MAG: response regulator [Spirochaetota bacterium]